GERELWRHLHGRRFAKYKFRRQQPIGTFIADFVCFTLKLVVEVDGGYHDKPEQQKLDDLRAAYLRESSFTVIRFSNDEVLRAMPDVLDRIHWACKERKVYNELPSPLAGEGGATDRS